MELLSQGTVSERRLVHGNPPCLTSVVMLRVRVLLQVTEQLDHSNHALSWQSTVKYKYYTFKTDNKRHIIQCINQCMFVMSRLRKQ